MKKILLILFISTISFAATFQTLKVGNSNSQTFSAVFEVGSSTKGILIPKLTTAQKNSLTNPSDGLMIYDTSLGSIANYKGGSSLWNTISPQTAKGDLIGYSGSSTLRIPGGSSGQVLTYDTSQSGNIKWTSTATNSQSFFRVGGATVTGGSSTSILYFPNTVASAGSDISLVSNSSFGTSFVINTAGCYYANFGGRFTSGSNLWIVKNASATFDTTSTTYIASISGNGTNYTNMGNAAILAVGDVVRVLDDTNASGYTVNNFTITRCHP